MLLACFQSLAAAGRGDAVESYNQLDHAAGAFQTAFEKDTAWSLPVLHALDLALRLAAVKADAAPQGARRKGGATAGRGDDAAKVVPRRRDRPRAGRDLKKWGALHVINNLFKIYFHLNNLRLCQNLIRAVEGPGFPKALECQVISGRHFPIGQLVTYHYFVGRLSLLNSQFARAERQLSFAFTRCPASAHSNKRQILRYLVPVRLVLGVYPSPALLQKYDLPYYANICRAVHRGDLRAFERELDFHQQRFIRHGSYLLVERAKVITYRNFFKRVHSLHPAGTAKLDITAFQRCLEAVGLTMDRDEVECVLANLIYKGYVKGYLSHQHAKLVVSKGNAFPPLREVLGGEAE